MWLRNRVELVKAAHCASVTAPPKFLLHNLNNSTQVDESWEPCDEPSVVAPFSYRETIIEDSGPRASKMMKYVASFNVLQHSLWLHPKGKGEKVSHLLDQMVAGAGPIMALLAYNPSGLTCKVRQSLWHLSHCGTYRNYFSNSDP